VSSAIISALLFISVSAASPPAHAKTPPRTPRAQAARPVNSKIVQPPTPVGGGGPIMEGQWQVVDVPAGSTVSAQGTSSPPVTTTSDQHVYVIEGDDGVSASPLPQGIKDDLVPPSTDGEISISEEGGTSFYMVSQEIAEGIDASEQAGQLTPEIDAIAEPLDEDTGGSTSSVTTEGFPGFGSCATHHETYTKDNINISDKSFSKNFDLSGGFSGTFSATAHVSGTVNVTVLYDVKRYKVLGKCVPYGAKLTQLHITGNAASEGGLDVAGTLNYEHEFGPWEIADTNLYNFTFYAGWVPVVIRVNMPVNAGLKLDASATGSLNFNGSHHASGTFDYTCTLDGCNGNNTFANPPDSTQEITGGVGGHIKPQPWIDVAFKASLYTDSVAYAQIGARPYLLGDLWGYDGSACGDADSDGVNELVHALTFDLDGRIDITGKAGILGRTVWDSTLSTGSIFHLGFFKLNGSSALQPLFQGTSGLDPGATGQYKMKIRPCWPYTDQVTYKVDFGDGGAPQTFQGAPGTDVQVSHSWTAEGSPTVTATSVSDQHGRSLDEAYSRTLQIKALGITVTPSPGSATYGTPITWTATATGGDPTTTKFAFFRRLAGTTPWNPDVTAANWQTSRTFTWTPTAAEVGVWEIVLWVKDASTPASQNTYGYAAYVNAGPVQVVAPLAVTSTSSPAVVVYGTTITWTATATGGTPGTIQYTVGHQLAGTTNWLPSPSVFQSSNVLTWTPTAADVGTWAIGIGVKDVNTPANAPYGVSASTLPGTVRVVAPLSVSITPSPASSVYGNPITWTATPSGGDSATIQYAFFRRRAGTATWTPDVTAPAWQTSNQFTWTPALADEGGQPWEIIVWAKDVTTPASMNTYGYAAYANPGPVQVTTPPLTLSTTASPAYSTAGNAITWTVTAAGGNPNTRQYAFFHRIAGTTTWTPDVTAPAWQTSPSFTWTPTTSQTGTWEIIFWVKDGDTPATQNTYGYGAYVNAGPVQVVAPLTLSSTPTSPATVTAGTTLTWTLSSTGGVPGTVQYTLARQLSGTSNWLPSPLVFQSGNVVTWTPTAADVGTWTIGMGVRDSLTSPTANGFGVDASVLPGTVKVVGPLTLTTTASPSTSPSGTTITWTATANGGDTATLRYAFFRRRAGTTPWTPDVTAPNWQTSNIMSWTPTATDAGTWEIVLWVKDGTTPASANGYGYAAYVNAGPVQVYVPETLTGTGSPAKATYGNAITWTATPSGGAGSFQYALFRRRLGTTPWTPDVSAPNWQVSNVLSWTPTSSDVGTWEIVIWVKDPYTPSTLNGYGYGAYYNAGTVQVVTPLSLNCPASPSPGAYGSAFTWTVSTSGGDPSSVRYALFRRRPGAPSWIPDVTAASWQTSNVLSWTPGPNDLGTWEIIIWAKDGTTPYNMNSYGYATYCNPGPIQVYSPITLTGTGSPSSAVYNTTVNWTATPSGGTAGTFQYALFRRRLGTTPWTPDVTAAAWQASNSLSWTPTSADTGTWEIIVWVKDAYTPATQNTYGYGAYYNAGTLLVTAPLSLSVTPSPSSSHYGTTINWTATASGGNPATTRYAFFRRLAGTSPWTPDVTAPNWQSSNTLSWTPTAGDVGTWEIIIWVKDGATPATQNTYGFAAYSNAGPVQITP